MSYAEWKAQELNALFKQHGVLKQPARITPRTVQDGIDKQNGARGMNPGAELQRSNLSRTKELNRFGYQKTFSASRVSSQDTLSS